MKFAAVALALAAPVYAKTDLEGCTSFTSMVSMEPRPGMNPYYPSIVYYVPDSLEICDFVDCGGGRAPPKNVPGCPLYKGTETVTPRFLASDPMKTEAPTTVPTATAPAATSTAVEEDSPVEEEEETMVVEESSHMHLSSTPTPTMITMTTTPTPVETPATTQGPEESGDETEPVEETSTDTPAAAMPTAVIGLNMFVGVAAAMALL